MSVPSRRLGLRRLVECAVLIAIGTVLSLFEFSGPWALGGGITVCSMLPLVLICHRHGTKWGICSALVYGVLQMFLGMKNVMYGQNFWQVLAIILLDYVVAFGVIGLAGIFDKCIKNRPVSIAVGSVFATLLRLAYWSRSWCASSATSSPAGSSGRPCGRTSWAGLPRCGPSPTTPAT